ncbi:MAG: hypothetical protein WC050_03925 [Candidatus Paceibacterota bacterium]
MYRTLASRSALVFATLALPGVASAHEVYVLAANQIAVDTTEPPFDMIAVALQNMHQFAFWAFIGLLAVFIVFFISILHPVERTMGPFLARMKRRAPAVARVTVGIALLAGAYYQASFGPELPLRSTFGAFTPLITIVLVALGFSMIFNVLTRWSAAIALLLYAVTFYFHGSYMLTYTNYVGEFIVLLIGAHHGYRFSKSTLDRILNALAPYSFAILRVCFGFSLLFASLYAKILHNNLALQVATVPLAGHTFGIAHYLGFEPHFLVLGAAIIEIVIALFFMLGVEIRFTSLFLEFWLMLSLLYFGESVWPHLILIGIPIALFIHGYDRVSLEGRFFSKGDREPVF